MKQFYLRSFLWVLFCFCVSLNAFSQTITVTNFDNSIVYSPGSSIAVPFHIDNATGTCIATTNTFSLYLSNAAGIYPGTPIATSTGFYATFINGVIPTGTLPGAGYRVKVTSSSNPSATIVESGPFAIVAGAAIQAGVEPTTSTPLIADAVFGVCDKSQPTFSFDYISKSTAGTSGIVKFINESTGTVNTVNSLNGTFSAQQTNYTAVVKAGDGVVNGTKAYTIINNTINNNIGSSSSTSGCLSSSGSSVVLNYVLNINQLQSNFPGNTYQVNWGDGSTSSTYTLCDLVNSGGTITHTFTKSSCGNSPQAGRNNVFEIDIQPISPFCGAVGTVASTYANITLSPKNTIVGPVGVTCTGAVTFSNASYPGEDPSSTANNCRNFDGARYTWFVDGVATRLNVPIGTAFTPTLTKGNHVITLHLNNNPTVCNVDDATYNICVQDPPTPNFTLSAPQVCASAGVIISNTSAIDNTCSAPVYNWSVSAPAGATPVTTTGGTDLHSAEPKFVFATAGKYILTLTMPDACGRTYTKSLPVMIDATPTVTLEANTAYCGAQVLTFNNAAGSATRVTYTGSADPTTAAYLWTVNAPAGAGAATFVNGTTANSQYPQISFPGFGNYTVSVKYTNTCGSPIATQTINIQQAPTVSAGPDGTVCAATGNFIPTASISDMSSVVSYQWTTNGDGTFANSTSSLTPTYNLGTNDKKGGNIRLTLTVKTSLIGTCGTIITSMNLLVTPIVTVTSPATVALCSGNALNYNITASQTGATYSWTATGTANITGYQGGGTTNPITDFLVNSDPVNSGTVTYTITPSANGCPGTPFTFTVTVDPKPVLTLSNVIICSGKPAGIVLNSAMKYSWISTVINGTANGNRQQATAINTTGITDVLNNAGTIQAVVRYTITPISASGCPGDPVSVDVTIEPQPTQPTFAQVAVSVCDVTSYQLNGTNPIVGTGAWTETTGKPVVFSDATNPASTVSGLVAGTIYNFTWTISTACSSNSASFQLTNNLPSVGGTASAAATNICYDSNGTITLSGNVGNVTAWQQSTDNGVSWQNISGNNTNTSYAYTNLRQTTAFRAVVTNGNCSVAYSSQATIIVSQPTVVPNAGADQTLCNQTSATLQGNSAGTSTGIWTQKAGPTAGVVINDPSSATATVSGLTGGNVYTFTWTILGQPPCGNLVDDVVITNQSPMSNVISYSGNTTICSGTSITITGSTPTGGIAPYTYIWETSIDNGATWVLVNGQTSKDLSTAPDRNTDYRRTVFSNQQICSVVSNVITINTQVALANNSISTAVNPVCYNTAPALITGTTPTGGDGIYFYKWQQSTDGVTFTDIASATGKDYQPPVLIKTTVYRRVVSTTLCVGVLGNTSAPLTIDVTPPLVANFTATKTADCVPFNINSIIVKATPDNNAKSYTWFADNVQIGNSLVFPGYTITTQAKTVTIKLVVASTLGCPDAIFSMDFTTPVQSTAAFAIDKTTGCGPLAVNFTNNSTPLAGAIFTWDFDDGTTYTGTIPPAHTFQPDPNGRDKVYNVKLTANGCAPNTVSRVITVYPAKPVPVIDPGPLTGCAPYNITVKNLTLGTNTKYDFYLFNENNVQVQTLSRTDKSDVTFSTINASGNTKTYTVYMIATGPCGVTNKSVVYPITITPSGITAKMNVTPTTTGAVVAGCAPFATMFNNLSTGGKSYMFNIYDAGGKLIDNIPTINTDPVTYPFNTPGNYSVSISVISDCATPLESTPRIPVTVYPLPIPSFTPDKTVGCSSLTVNFTNTTASLPNSPASSFTYLWDFGDGTAPTPVTNAVQTHTFAARSTPYTVTLTAKTNFGCSQTTIRIELISVNPLPETDFTASPGLVTDIPNYTFAFTDKSKQTPVSWYWDFGDNSKDKTSTLRNPSHSYADTGKYKVTLVTYSQYGCTDSKTYTVQVKGVPGQLFIPNAFVPSSLTPELRKFTVKGSGLKSWTMRIFNIWGQMVFETTKLNDKGEPIEFWDGSFKGAPGLQGTYAWEISAVFKNGTDWKGMSYRNGAPKKAGTLNLIR